MDEFKPRAGNLPDAYLNFTIATKPNKFYVIAFSPRSASSFLCDQLWRTGSLGAAQEYFDYLNIMPKMISRLGCESLREYLNAMFALRTSPNGVFGFKAHPHQYQFVQLASLLQHFPGLKFIHLRRTDKLAQAVSFARALQTKKWQSRSVEESPPEYNFGQIQGCLRTLRQFDLWWEQYFKTNRIQPFRIIQEELIADPASIVENIFKYLHVDADLKAAAQLPSIAPLESVSDSVNADWVQRFQRDAHSRDLLKQGTH